MYRYVFIYFGYTFAPVHQAPWPDFDSCKVLMFALLPKCYPKFTSIPS